MRFDFIKLIALRKRHINKENESLAQLVFLSRKKERKLTIEIIFAHLLRDLRIRHLNIHIGRMEFKNFVR